MNSVLIFPPAFWVFIVVLLGGAFWAWLRIPDGTGLPMLTVLGTVAFWYLGDVFYNDYANNHAKLFEPAVLQKAWWQVALFVAVFLCGVPVLHRHFNARCSGRSSGVLQLFKNGVSQPQFQSQIRQMFRGCVLIWSILALIAVILLRERALHFFFPFFGEKTSPWSHGRIGKGFDSLSILAVHLHLLVATSFGVIAVLSTNRRTCMLALFCCLTSWPYFILDRTRYIILMLVLPGMLSWVFLRLRGGILKKVSLLGMFFLLVNAWMGFIIANRTDTTIIAALKEKGFNFRSNEEVRHEGLNMYEELCWVDTFIQRGTYTCNWGYRYFTELVNPIPRFIWPGKPLIGLDYALARGQGGADDSDSGGVWATISTGVIGQGAVNFGGLIGPAFAALLMSFWAVYLARLDLEIHAFGRLPLYGLGLGLTINLGRDITLGTLYPFIFGSLLAWWWQRSHRGQAQPSPKRHFAARQQRFPKLLRARPVQQIALGGRSRGRLRRLTSPHNNFRSKFARPRAFVSRSQ